MVTRNPGSTHQLRLVVYPIIYKVLYIPGGCLGFLNHQQYQEASHDLLLLFFGLPTQRQTQAKRVSGQKSVSRVQALFFLKKTTLKRPYQSTGVIKWDPFWRYQTIGNFEGFPLQ